MNYAEDLTHMYHNRYIQGSNHTTKGEIAAMNDNLRLDIARLEAKQDVAIQMLQQVITYMQRGAQGLDVNTLNFDQPSTLTVAEASLLRRLTIKQHCVAQLLMEGWKNAEIAEVMDVTENTIKLHVSAVAKKIGVKTRGQIAVAYRDILAKSSTGEYEAASGGLPMDWGKRARAGMDDPLAPLYAPQKKG